jgi:peptide/nickel transport system permease protein
MIPDAERPPPAPLTSTGPLPAHGLPTGMELPGADRWGRPPTGSLRGDAWRRFRRNRLAVFGLVLIALLLAIALFGPFFLPDPLKQSPVESRLPPSRAHLMGTDRLGRDVAARVVHGARLSLGIGVAVVLLETLIGVSVGAVAGWFGGVVDTVLSRLIDIMLGIPYLLLAFALISVLGRGVLPVIITLAATAWLVTARVLRSAVLQAKSQEYVEAARAIGVPTGRLIVRHILPNSIQPVIVLMAIGIGSAILAEAALSFLGVGVAPPAPSWGLMISESRGFLSTSPHLLFFPALAAFLTVLGFLLVGDGLRDALDVRDTGTGQ